MQNEAEFVPAATGTAEPGGWTTRELLSILDGLSGMEVVGADVGEYVILANMNCIDGSVLQ